MTAQPFWTRSLAESASALDCGVSGLTSADAIARLTKYGRNADAQVQEPGLIISVGRRLLEPMCLILIAAAWEKLQRRGLVPLRRDDRFQDLAFMVDSPPEIAELAVDLHERLIQMPPPLRIAAHVRHPLLSDLSGKHRAELVPPKPNRLMADVDPALGQEILDVAQRQRVLHVHQHRQTDYLGRAVEIAERVAHG